MKICVIKNEGSLSVIQVAGYNPKNCIGMLPTSTPKEDFKFVEIDADGIPYICEKKKSKWLKEQIQNG